MTTSKEAGLPRSYVAMHRDDAVYQASSSGGVFTALTDAFFGMGGEAAIYGCAMGDGMRAAHVRATGRIGRDAMRGSKYVQSSMAGVYWQVERDLAGGARVLFSGTPCQVAAVLSYLRVKRADTNELMTVDLVCHGVASGRLWDDFVADLECRYGGHAVSANFRSKRTPGQIQDLSVRFDNGRRYSVPALRFDWFYTVYHSNTTLRPSCYQCPFARPGRVSDLTLADAWGVARPDGRGSSLVVASTERGMRLLEAALVDLEVREAAPGEVSQPQLRAPVERPGRADELWEVYEREGYLGMQEWFGNATRKRAALKAVAMAVERLGLRSFAKRALGKGGCRG